MSTNITALLDELYALEPSLKEKEKSIITIIERMLQSRPDVPVDDDFKNELRERVIRELRLKQTARLFNWKFFLAGFSTVAVASFGIFTLVNILNAPSVSPPTPLSTPKVLSFAPSVQSTAQNAFGAVKLNPSPSTPSQTEGFGGQGDARGNMSENATKSNASPVSTAKMAAGGGDAMIMPPQDIPYYQYSFTGTLPTVTGAMKVYKKTSLGFDSSATRSILDAFRLDTFNLGALQNAGLGYATFFEDRDYGYAVNIDFTNGSISLTQNWQKWPQPKCDTSGCEQPTKLTEKDVPSDEEFIRIANEFLAQYGINRSIYGEPKVDEAPRIMYARATSGGQEAFLPEQFNVSYPLKLDDKNLYEEYGAYRGVTLSIDIRTKRVIGMYGLEKENLVASEYTNQTDAERLAKIIKFGGRYETRPYEGQKTVDVTLGTPTIEYVHVYGEWKDGKSDEYYVPAYVFQVNQKENRFGPSIIAVPLVKDFATFTPLDNSFVGPQPIPATMEATSPLIDPIKK